VILIYLCPTSMKEHWLYTTIVILNKCITLYNDKMDNYIMIYNVHKLQKLTPCCILQHYKLTKTLQTIRMTNPKVKKWVLPFLMKSTISFIFLFHIKLFGCNLHIPNQHIRMKISNDITKLFSKLCNFLAT
jgi:hypothetical protein